MFLYVTCDKIGSQTGGGSVTYNELQALNQLGSVDIINPKVTPDPFEAEKSYLNIDFSKYKLAHFYAGTFPELTRKLKDHGVKITYTAAAHDLSLSREEFNAYGIPFDFPHINNPELWNKYLLSYLNADLVICPSIHSKNVMHGFGCHNVSVIPHGCHEGHFKSLPKKFSVGYLGQIGPDKGLRYLIEAWSKLCYKDSFLYLAGSQSPHLINLIRHYNAGNIIILGFVKHISELYNSINLYVQPSVTEGFGIEILEAMTYGRPVVASDGAGAADCLHSCCKIFEKRNVNQLAEFIDLYKNDSNDYSFRLIEHSKQYSWEKIQSAYVETWKKII